jgi:hypothetical protein
MLGRSLYKLWSSYLIVGKINFTIDDALEDKFRDAAFKYVGKKKGCLSRAFEDALRTWIDKKTARKKLKQE